MTSSNNLPADPRAPVLAGPGELGEAFVEWFLNASADQRQAFADEHADSARARLASGELTRSETPATWRGAPTAAPWVPPEALEIGQRARSLPLPPGRRAIPATPDSRTGPACA